MARPPKRQGLLSVVLLDRYGLPVLLNLLISLFAIFGNNFTYALIIPKSPVLRNGIENGSVSPNIFDLKFSVELHNELCMYVFTI